MDKSAIITVEQVAIYTVKVTADDRSEQIRLAEEAVEAGNGTFKEIKSTTAKYIEPFEKESEE